MMAASGNDESLYQLSVKNVVNAIADVVEWRELGIQLELPTPKLGEIQEDNKHSSSFTSTCRSVMVIEWIKGDTSASWTKLVKALRSPNLKKYHEVAVKIEEQYIYRRGSDMSICTPSIPSSTPSSPMSPMSLDSPLDPPPYPNFPTNITPQSKNAKTFWVRSVSMATRSFSGSCIWVANRLQEKKVNVQDLCSFINGYPQVATPQRDFSTIKDVFDFLTANNIWDYWNHFLLEDIVEEFGNEDAEMIAKVDKHKQMLSGLFASVKIAECLANGSFDRKCRVSVLRRNCDELKWKLGDVMDEALTLINKIWRSLNYLGLPSKDVVLDRIQGGCVMVVWLIQSIKSDVVREKAKSNTALFERFSVLWIKINEDCIYQAEGVGTEELQPPLQGVVEDGGETREQQLTEVESEEKVTKKTKTRLLELMKSAVKPIKQIGPWIQKKRLDLVGACRGNNVDAVMFILEQEGVNVNMRESDKHGWGPIMWACENGNFEIVKRLIDCGADVNIKAKDNNWTSLIIASQRGHLAIVQLLLDHNAVVDTQTNEGSTALIWSLYNRHIEISRLLVDRGANVNIGEKNGWTPIFRASNKGLVEMVKLLCDRGAEVNQQAERGWTALMAATNQNHKEVVDVLIERGADPNLKMTDTNEHALHVASYRGHAEIATALLRAQSDKNACNKEGLTTLMVATNRGHLDTVDALIAGGVDIDQPHEVTGWTALFLSAKAGKLDMFKKLLHHGASTNIQGIQVEDVASYFKRSEILKEVNRIRQLPSVPESVPPDNLMEPPTDIPETPVVVELPVASTDQDKTIDKLEETKTEPLDTSDTTPTPVPPSIAVEILDKDTPIDTDTHSPIEEDAMKEPINTPSTHDDIPAHSIAETDKYPKSGDDSATKVTQEKIESPQEPTTVAVESPKSQPKDFKSNMQLMEQILKAFNKRVFEQLVLQGSGDNRQQSKGVKSAEEITHEQTIITAL